MLMVTDQGQVLSCGNNENGELGFESDETYVDIPTLVDSFIDKTIV